MYGAREEKKKEPHNTDLETQIHGRLVIAITAKVLVDLYRVLAPTSLKKKAKSVNLYSPIREFDGCQKQKKNGTTGVG